MKEIRSYKTADNRIFESKEEATSHEFMLKIRGLIQRNLGVSKQATNPTDVATIIASHFGELGDMITSHKRSMNGFMQAKNIPIKNNIIQ